jgi:hypothetical protein
MKTKVRITRKADPSQTSGDAIYKGNLELAINATRQAKDLSPWREGRLRNSIMYNVANKEEGGFNDRDGADGEKKIKSRPKRNQAYVGTATEYAIYQELLNPYLRPAIAIIAGEDSMQVLDSLVNKEFAKKFPKYKG